MQENRISTHISVGHPAWSKKPQAKFAGQPLQQQAWPSPSSDDLPGLPENPSNPESSFPFWSGAFSCFTDHGLSCPTPNSDHQGYFQQDERYSVCPSASYRMDRNQFHHLHTEILFRTLLRNTLCLLHLLCPCLLLLAVFQYTGKLQHKNVSVLGVYACSGFKIATYTRPL
jgi:hypothetical protein